jgi:hypothetical protein
LKRRKRAGLILAAIFSAAFYLILFPQPVGKEQFLVPVWALDLNEAVSPGMSSSVENQSFHWFRIRDRFGYVGIEGDLRYQDRLIHNVALSNSGFINFARIPENLVYKNPDGAFLYGIPSFGYPLLEPSGTRLYTVNTNLSGIKAWSGEGETIWQADFFSPLTSISLKGEECLLGLLEGKIMFFGPEGELLYEVVEAGSRLPVVLATALRNDAEQLAWISGIDPQRLSIVNRKDSDFSLHYSLDLDSDFRREILLRYFEEGKFLLFEAPGGIKLLDLARRRIYAAALPDRVREVALASERDMLAVGTGSGAGSTLLVFHPLNRRLYAQQLESSDLFLKIIDNHLLVGLPYHLLRLDLQEG